MRGNLLLAQVLIYVYCYVTYLEIAQKHLFEF